MSSITSCIAKAGKLLATKDREAILAANIDYQARGLNEQDAAELAIKDQIKAVSDAMVQPQDVKQSAARVGLTNRENSVYELEKGEFLVSVYGPSSKNERPDSTTFDREEAMQTAADYSRDGRRSKVSQLLQRKGQGYGFTTGVVAQFKDGVDVMSLAADEDGVPDMEARATAWSPSVKQSPARTDQTDTPAFKQWFGDSKVVDAQGEPLVVYHGTNSDIQMFNTNGGAGKTSDTGAFFADNPYTASTYATGATKGGNVVPTYLSLKHPVIIDAGGFNWNSIQQKSSVELPAVDVVDQQDENLLAN
ncbi:MAG: hypothetical protein H7238_09350, partial [Polaromonas sp.]|nr:hypothetical protein [Polaromonas sp.]